MSLKELDDDKIKVVSEISIEASYDEENFTKKEKIISEGSKILK